MDSSVHKFYGKIRPILYRVGLLKLARKLFSSELRAKVAKKLGLEKFDVAKHNGYVVPERAAQSDFIFDGINFIGDLHVPLGTGEAARELLRAIETAGIPTAQLHVPLRFKEKEPSQTVFASEDAPYSVNLIHINPAEMPHALETSLPNVITDRYLIAYWHWELATFPSDWVNLIDYFDEIWVASEFVKKTIESVSTVPVTCMPIPVSFPEPQKIARIDKLGHRFVFLTIFSPTSNVARKNPFGVIDAFRLAFKDMQHDAILVVKTHHLDTEYGELLRGPLQAAVDDINGILLTDTLDKRQIFDLIASSDCLVSLHRTEGFGLTIAEAMLLGKPVICTGYSGNMDYTTKDNSFLVNYHLREIIEDDHVYFPPMNQLYQLGELWAEPDMEHAARLMHHVYTERENLQKICLQAQKTILNRYSHAHVGELIKQHLETKDKFREDRSRESLSIHK